MNNKYINRITALVVMVIFVCPLSLKAQTEIETRYEKATQLSNEELAQILAPIALYPDALLSQMLIAASYPFEVVEAERWLTRNPGLTDEALDNALSQKDWDVSVLSLCHYPKVLNMMSENINWTAKLGDAFVNQEQDVMDTVQELRARASAQGNLATTNEQRVIVEERIIRIEPAYNDYVYVPVYDPVIVYGPWWLPAFLPFHFFYPGVVVTGPRIVFAPRLFVGFGAIGWSAFNWHDRNVVIVNIDRTRRFYRHANVYRGPERYHWQPDHQRRVVRSGSDTFVPPGRKPRPSGPPQPLPRVIKDNKPIVRDRRPADTVKNPQPLPRVIKNDKPIVSDRGPAETVKTPQPQPRVIKNDKPIVRDRRPADTVNPPQPLPRVIKDNKPIVRDRGPAETVKTPQPQPRIENKGVTGTVKGAERGNSNNQRDIQGEGRGGSEGNDGQRGDGRGGGNRGQRR